MSNRTPSPTLRPSTSSVFGAGFLTGGVTFCAMMPMRSIPFRVLCLIGMNENAAIDAAGHDRKVLAATLVVHPAGLI